MTEFMRKPFEIYTMELDFNEYIPLPRLCKAAMDLADLHALKLGWGMESLFEKKQGWVLIQFHIKVEKYPLGRGVIEVKTWPSGSESRYAFREFQFFQENSEVPFASASTNWILLDLEKGRPVRVSDYLSKIWDLDTARTLENNFDDIKAEGEPTACRDFPIRLTDIDPLKHMSNVKYIDCVIESVPGEIWKDYEISELWIEFRKQAVFGNVINSKIYELNSLNNSEKEFIHILSDKNTDGTTFARAKSIRRKR